MNPAYPDRRGTYFLFQGLLTAVLLLLLYYQHHGTASWLLRCCLLTLSLVSTLVLLKSAPSDLFSLWWVQTSLFLFDAGIIAIVLAWTQLQSDFFLLYVLILFGTALTRSYMQSFILGIVIAILYLISGWTARSVLPQDSGFWLKFDFLCVVTSLMAILSRDAKQALQEQENLYRERTIQIERLATLGQMAGEVAHRIKSPLTTIMVNAEILSYKPKQSKKALEGIQQIQDAVRHCQDILKNLLDLGRIEETAFIPLDLREPIESALKSLTPQIQQKSIHLEILGLGSPRMVLGESSLLHEAVGAVLQNAVDAVAKDGKIAIRLDEHRQWAWWNWQSKKQEYVIVVEDNGLGIPFDNLERVFQPFFSTKNAQGSGLGLSAALRILQKHGGTIEASSYGPGRGARFSLILPVLNHHEIRSEKVGKSARKSKSR